MNDEKLVYVNQLMEECKREVDKYIDKYNGDPYMKGYLDALITVKMRLNDFKTKELRMDLEMCKKKVTHTRAKAKKKEEI